jgi:hypothetical protein
MNATVDVVDLSALMPESSPTAQLHTDSGTAVDRGARAILSGNPALANSGSFATGARRSKISMRSIKPYARRYVIVAENFRDAVLQEYDRVKQPSLIASVERVLKPTEILDELEHSPVIYKYMKRPNI